MKQLLFAVFCFGLVFLNFAPSPNSIFSHHNNATIYFGFYKKIDPTEKRTDTHIFIDRLT